MPTEQDATNSKPSKKQRRLEKLLEKRERLAVSNEEAYAPLPEGEEHFAAPRAHKEAVGPSGVSQADDVGEWWMCDGCGSGIPGGKKRCAATCKPRSTVGQTTSLSIADGSLESPVGLLGLLTGSTVQLVKISRSANNASGRCGTRTSW